MNQDKFQFIIDGDLQPLRRRLNKGQIVPARIILCMSNNRYLLRIYGYNLVMKSALNFRQFQEIDVRIKDISQYFILEIVSVPGEQNEQRMAVPGHTDFRV